MVLEAVGEAVCMHVVLPHAAICGADSWRHHCLLNVRNRGCWVSQVQQYSPSLHTSHERLSLILKPLACLTMSHLPTKFHPCWLIPCVTLALNYFLDSECMYCCLQLSLFALMHAVQAISPILNPHLVPHSCRPSPERLLSSLRGNCS